MVSGMSRTDVIEKEGYIYAPYIPVTDGLYINGVKVWDHRWWVNIFCKINWFFHFRMRKRFNKYKNTKIDEKYYGTINCK